MLLLTVERGPAVSNGNESVNFERDEKDETGCSDNTEDSDLVDASIVNDTTATQLRPQWYYLNDRDIKSIIMTNKLLP